MFPKFDEAAQRVLVDQQTKINTLVRMLRNEDKIDEQDNPERLKTFVFDPETLLYQFSSRPQCCCCNCQGDTKTAPSHTGNWDRKDRIQEALYARLERFCKKSNV